MVFFHSKTSSKILPKYTIALFFSKENPGDFPEAEKAPGNKSIIGIFLSAIEKNCSQRYTVKENCSRRYAKKLKFERRERRFYGVSENRRGLCGTFRQG